MNDKNIVITVNAYIYRDVATKMLVANDERQRQAPTALTLANDGQPTTTLQPTCEDRRLSAKAR